MAEGRFVAYYRVSTKGQGRSGLGLEAQRHAVEAYLNGGRWSVLAELVEIESGKRNDRPRLQEALSLCRAHCATLVIGKLDRLARNARFLLGIVESGVDTVFCDLPTVPPGPVGKFIITQMAAVAELEAGLTSERTKAALTAAKARGVRLGSPGCNLTAGARLKGSRAGVGARRAMARARAADLRSVIEAVRAEGVPSVSRIAATLNARQVPTPSGRGSWQASTVQRILRAAA